MIIATMATIAIVLENKTNPVSSRGHQPQSGFQEANKYFLYSPLPRPYHTQIFAGQGAFQDEREEIDR